MPSSTSSSKVAETLTATEGSSYFVCGLMMIAIALSFALAMGHAAGRLYHPQPLTVSRADLNAAEHIILAFGNSRFYSSIAYDRLSEELSEPGSKVKVIEFTGGGWDSLHYYMLALLACDVLRPGKDAVLVEVSPLSENDADTHNKLGAIRPDVAIQLASVPGLPLEARLDILTGAVAGVYRYRLEIQNQLIGTRIERAVSALSPPLLRAGVLRPEFRKEPFQVITLPGRNYVVKEVRGDTAMFRDAMRKGVVDDLTTLKFGGYKFTALERAVRCLRDRGITVFLIQTPTSLWLRDRLGETLAGTRYQREITDLAQRTGAILLADWPVQFFDQDRFRDDMHMYGGDRGINPFTDLLAHKLMQQEMLNTAGHLSNTSLPSR